MRKSYGSWDPELAKPFIGHWEGRELTAYPYISAKIKQYNLGLREADYRQISYLRIIDLPEKRAVKRHVASSNGKYAERHTALASVR